MASSSNVNGNLVDELEEAFQVSQIIVKFELFPFINNIFLQMTIDSLTKEDSTGIDKDEIKLEVDQTTLKFIDLARQMEAFFLQKRFLLSALKPDLLLKEENFDLKQEISRKDELIKKHYDKIETWRGLLNDQQQNFNKPNLPVGASGTGGGGGPGGIQSEQIYNPPAQMMPNNPIMQVQQQQMQAQQMQQMPVGPPGQQMFMGGPRVGGGGVGFNQGSTLQGPLAYLERSASNIDLVGMGDGRR